jgi:Transglycosylase SLT domain
MASNILSEYLVKLGYAEDKVAAAGFARALRDADSLVERQFSGMAKTVLAFQSTAIGAFASVGAAALGIAEKTAMADQEYRLLGLHMYTTKDTARSLKIALDALGQPLENVIWDKELAARFEQLIKDQRIMTEELGPGFERQMIKIRDVRFEFSRFGVELEYLTMRVVEDFAAAFGMNIDDVLGKLREFNDWFVRSLPEISSWIVSRFKPVLVDVWNVLKDTYETAKLFGAEFTNLVGILSGDKSLEGTAFNFDKLATAIQRSVHWVADLVMELNNFAKVFAHLVGAAADLAHGDTGGAKRELGSAIDSLLTVPGLSTGMPKFDSKGLPNGFIGAGNASSANIKAAIAHDAALFNVPPELALAVAQAESGFRQYDRNGNVLKSTAPGSHATGIFQLQPGTARDMGVDPNDPSQNIAGGLRYLSKLLAASGGNQEMALGRYYGSKNPEKNREYAQGVMSIEAGVHIDNLTINVPSSNLSHESIKKATTEAIQEAAKQRVQRNLMEFYTPGWSY